MNAEMERLEQKKLAIDAQIKAHAEKRTAHIEFQRLKVMWVEIDGERCLSIKKELNSIVLMQEDAAQLLERLDAMFTDEPEAEAAA
jgi:hypothetical protein